MTLRSTGLGGQDDESRLEAPVFAVTRRSGRSLALCCCLPSGARAAALMGLGYHSATFRPSTMRRHISSQCSGRCDPAGRIPQPAPNGLKPQGFLTTRSA